MKTVSFFRQAIVAISLLLCVTCVTAAADPAPEAQKTIAVTLPPLAGILHWMQPSLTAHCLLPEGAEPHHFHPGARQLERAAQADILLRSSADDGNWFDAGLISEARIMDVWPASEKGAGHAWLDFTAVDAALPHIARRLIKAGFIDTAQWSARQATLKGDVNSIQQQWQTILPALKKRGVLMQHPSWQPLFERLGVPVYAVLERRTAGHHHGFTAHRLEHALQAVIQHPDALLIADPRHDDKGLKWLQQQHPQSQLVYLSSMGSCHQRWPAFQAENIAKLQSALTNRQ